MKITPFTQIVVTDLFQHRTALQDIVPALEIRLIVIAFVTKPLNFQPPKKFMQQFFLGYSGPYFGPTDTNHTKNNQKITFGALFRIPPKMHYSALQCSAMD